MAHCAAAEIQQSGCKAEERSTRLELLAIIVATGSLHSGELPFGSTPTPPLVGDRARDWAKLEFRAG